MFLLHPDDFGTETVARKYLESQVNLTLLQQQIACNIWLLIDHFLQETTAVDSASRHTLKQVVGNKVIC